MRQRLTSLRARFLVAILLWVALGIGGVWFSSVRLFSDHVEAQYHEELEVHVKELAGLTVLDAQGRPHLSRPLSDPRYAVPLSGFYWQVSRPGYGKAQSPSMTRGTLNDSIAHSPHILHRVANGPTGPTIVYGFVGPSSSSAPLHYVISTDERHLLRVIKAFTRELTVWLVLLALALVASGFGIITFGLRPFGALAHAIRDLRAGKADVISGPYPDEMQEFVSDLNAYARRNDAIVERARVQAGNLAHSLRTPLAIVTDEAERLLENDGTEQQAQVFLDQSEAMQRQIDYHLARVRSGGTRQAIGARSVLAEVLPPILGAMRRIYPAITFSLGNGIAEAPKVAVDPEDLSEILSNLLDNAGKWASKSVLVTCSDRADRVQVEIRDDGPGVAENSMQRVFDIGVSLSATNKGSGLGLAISRDIARDYEGEITLHNLPEGGLAAQVVLPRC